MSFRSSELMTGELLLLISSSLQVAFSYTVEFSRQVKTKTKDRQQDKQETDDGLNFPAGEHEVNKKDVCPIRTRHLKCCYLIG